MMASTHALYGMAAGAVLASVTPGPASQAMLAGFVGGIVPDFDAYAAHRRTLHAPILGSGAAVLAVAVAVIAPGPLTLLAASALAGAALHAVMDIGGGGLSLEPWAEQPERAVYSHAHGRWLGPRRYIAYDGSVGDLALGVVAGIPLLVTTTGPLRVLVGGALVLSVAYVLVRRRLVAILRALLRRTPDRLQVLIPRRADEARE